MRDWRSHAAAAGQLSDLEALRIDGVVVGNIRRLFLRNMSGGIRLLTVMRVFCLNPEGLEPMRGRLYRYTGKVVNIEEPELWVKTRDNVIVFTQSSGSSQRKIPDRHEDFTV